MIRHRVQSDKCTDRTVLLTSNALLMASPFYTVSAHSPLHSSLPHFPAHSFINLHGSTLHPHQNTPSPHIPHIPPILSVTKSRCPFPKPCLEFLNAPSVTDQRLLVFGIVSIIPCLPALCLLLFMACPFTYYLLLH